MRRWLFFIAVLGGIYVLFRLSAKKEERSLFRKRLSEAFTIIVWTLLSVYVLAFLYWLYTQIFK